MTALQMKDVWLSFATWTVGADLPQSVQEQWLKGLSEGESDEAFVLGHADDGVLWGVLRNGELTMAVDKMAQGNVRSLRSETLLDLRVFGRDRELRIWRVQGQLKACEVRESGTALQGSTKLVAVEDQSYALLGAENRGVRFSPASSLQPPAFFIQLVGSAGQTHSPPSVDGQLATRLCVRHYYIQDNDDGMLRVAEHRLLGLLADKERAS